MPTGLKRVNLMLDEPLVKRLRAEARRRHLSMSAVARAALGRELATREEGRATLDRILRRRAALGEMPPSEVAIREARDRR